MLYLQALAVGDVITTAGSPAVKSVRKAIRNAYATGGKKPLLLCCAFG
jgi:hypothetical protein